MTSQPPYFMLSPRKAPYLELAADGSYAACREFLELLQTRFHARVTETRDASTVAEDACSLHHKDKGYWFLEIDGQEYLLMRDRCGMCLWGPRPPESPATFLAIAELVGAKEQLSPTRRVLSRLGLGRGQADVR